MNNRSDTNKIIEKKPIVSHLMEHNQTFHNGFFNKRHFQNRIHLN